MINDDLSGLLTPPDGPDFGFRQGTVLTFDLFSGANSIAIAGAVLTDVPFLNTAGFTAYLPGDVVVLVRMRSSWAVLGRVTIPGGTRAIGRWTELTEADTVNGASNYSLTTSYATKASLTVTIPPWCEVIAITVTLLLLAVNSTGSADLLNGKILLPGGQFTAWTSASVPAGDYAQLTVTHHDNVAVTGGSSFTILGQAATSGAAWAADASNLVRLQATVAFNSSNG